MESKFLFPEKDIFKLKITHVIKRNGSVVRFNKNRILDSILQAVVEVGGVDRHGAETLSDKVVSAINNNYIPGTIPTIEEIQDIVEKVLVENGHYKTAKAYILYRAEHSRVREERNNRLIVEDNIPYKLLWKVFSWNVDHDCDSIEKFNCRIRSGTFGSLVNDAENAYHAEIKKVAGRILKDRDRIRLVIVAGPSSSGKTTTTTKISESLKSEGMSFVLLNLDNYFKNLNEHPMDEYGDYDFEPPQALDLELINDHICKLIKGGAVSIPQYDFKSGKRTSKTIRLKLEKGQILLIDSLHGLYPDMTAGLPKEMKFKFYIEALCQIKDAAGEFVRWTDLRMLRRMVRDSWHRSYDPERTVGHWHYVRRSEKKYIVPYINKVDYVFNGALSYELPLYKKYLYENLGSIVRKYEKDPKKLDAYIRAKRVYKLLSEIEELPDDMSIPKKSLVREFIGGSSYKY